MSYRPTAPDQPEGQAGQHRPDYVPGGQPDITPQPTWMRDPQTGAWVQVDAPPSGWQPNQPPPGMWGRPLGPGEARHDTPGGRIDVPYERMGRGGGITGGILAVGLVILKYGAFLVKSKFLVYIAINVVLYALLFGAQLGPEWGLAFALGFVGLIFVHEMGHVIAAGIEGVPVSAPLFIPFMGAAIFLKANPRDARSEAIIAIGGPITGTLGSMAVYGLGRSLGGTDLGSLLVVLAGYGFFINLFNMIPARPLDGGRILGAVSKWFNLAGLAVVLGGMGIGLLPADSIILWVILAIIAYSTWQRFTKPAPPGYWNVSRTSRLVIGLGYVALLATLVLSYGQTEAYLMAQNVRI